MVRVEWFLGGGKGHGPRRAGSGVSAERSEAPFSLPFPEASPWRSASKRTSFRRNTSSAPTAVSRHQPRSAVAAAPEGASPAQSAQSVPPFPSSYKHARSYPRRLRRHDSTSKSHRSEA